MLVIFLILIYLQLKFRSYISEGSVQKFKPTIWFEKAKLSYVVNINIKNVSKMIYDYFELFHSLLMDSCPPEI